MENELEANFSEIINMIETRRNNAYRKVNEQLIGLYWDFGKYISEKVNDSNWGDKIVDKLVEFMKRKWKCKCLGRVEKKVDIISQLLKLVLSDDFEF